MHEDKTLSVICGHASHVQHIFMYNLQCNMIPVVSLYITLCTLPQVTTDLPKLASESCTNFNLEEELKKHLLPSPPRTPPQRKRKIAFSGPEAQKRLKEGKQVTRVLLIAEIEIVVRHWTFSALAFAKQNQH